MAQQIQFAHIRLQSFGETVFPTQVPIKPPGVGGSSSNATGVGKTVSDPTVPPPMLSDTIDKRHSVEITEQDLNTSGTSVRVSVTFTCIIRYVMDSFYSTRRSLYVLTCLSWAP